MPLNLTVPDPRHQDTRLSTALAHAGARGQTDKHELMRRASDTIGQVERMLAVSLWALDNGMTQVTAHYLVNVAALLGVADWRELLKE